MIIAAHNRADPLPSRTHIHRNAYIDTSFLYCTTIRYPVVARTMRGTQQPASLGSFCRNDDDEFCSLYTRAMRVEKM